MQLLATVSEHTHQVNLIKWFDLKHKEFAGRLFAIPNGGQRNIIVATKLKAEGVRSGVPDLMLPVQRGKFGGMFVEMKKIKGNITGSQSEWLGFLNSQGYYATVCYGFDDAAGEINKYLSLPVYA